MEWFTDLVIYYDLETGDPNLLITMINLFGVIFSLYFVIEICLLIKNMGNSITR